MPVYGYSKAVVNEYGLHELSEVSFSLGQSDLRRVAAFLLECADRADSGDWRNSHQHIGRPLTDCDVIVIRPDPIPPMRVVDNAQ